MCSFTEFVFPQRGSAPGVQKSRTSRTAALALRVSVSMAALCVANAALADCDAVVSGGSVSCTITDADGLSSVHVSAKGDGATSAQSTYSISNQAALIPNELCPKVGDGVIRRRFDVA